MKERPILFSAPMASALLAGTKTQTRRRYKPHRQEPYEGVTDAAPWWCDEYGDYHPVICPYGVPGDRLWVRETWGAADRFYQGHDLDTPAVVAYRADKSAIQWNQEPPRHIPADDLTQWNWSKVKWKPSIFMPRWASRITLEVTDVRFQRLHDISEKDARAEGVIVAGAQGLGGDWASSARDAYARLWDEINGKGAWERNGWVWVVSFARSDK